MKVLSTFRAAVRGRSISLDTNRLKLHTEPITSAFHDLIRNELLEH